MHTAVSILAVALQTKFSLSR